MAVLSRHPMIDPLSTLLVRAEDACNNKHVYSISIAKSLQHDEEQRQICVSLAFIDMLAIFRLAMQDFFEAFKKYCSRDSIINVTKQPPSC